MTGDADEHECPGGCGKRVANALVACAPDWRRLPAPYRSAIWRGLRARDTEAHARSVRAAYDWYQRNPR